MAALGGVGGEALRVEAERVGEGGGLAVESRDVDVKVDTRGDRVLLIWVSSGGFLRGRGPWRGDDIGPILS